MDSAYEMQCAKCLKKTSNMEECGHAFCFCCRNELIENEKGCTLCNQPFRTKEKVDLQPIDEWEIEMIFHCEKHPGKVLDLVCRFNKCNTYICSKCVPDHIGHKIEAIEDDVLQTWR